MYPPYIDKKYCPYIGISRTQGSQLFTIHLPNGDTYILNGEDAERYLESLGVAPTLNVLDYVQNLYRGILNRETEVIEWYNVDQFKQVMAQIVEDFMPRLIIDAGTRA